MLAILVLAGLPRPAAAAPGDPLLDYGADLVTDYVSRGQDFFVTDFARHDKAHSAFNFSPALQPWFTLYGPSGLSFGVWSSWALKDRKPDAATSFAGLQKADEIDYTLAWDWHNKLGAFSAGAAAYTFGPSDSASNEVFIKWSPPVLPALSPTLTHYVVPDAVPGGGATYTTVAIGGGERVNWKVSVGESSHLQNVTGSIGMPLGAFSVALNASYRPNPQLLLSGYDADGHYLFNGQTKDYPPTVFWLTLSYSGSVKE